MRQMQDISPNIEFTSTYETAIRKIGCKCKSCGHEWTAKPSNLLSGFGCPNCFALRRPFLKRISHEQFLDNLSKINQDIEIISTYENSTTNVLCKCKKCGNEWYAAPNNLMAGTSCPRCRKSRGERRISIFLDSISIPYTAQKKYEGLIGVGGQLLSFDFYLPNDNLLIEYQGEFHDHTTSIQTDECYAIQQEHDRRKKEYSNNHGIHLLEIWYYENNIESKILGTLSNCNKNPSTITA